MPDKGQPARPVRFLQEWLTKNVYLNLKQARFDLGDSRLRDDEQACTDCPQRTGHDKVLFADIKDGDRCLNPICFQAKLQKFVQITKAEVEEKQKRPAALISAYYGSSKEAEGVLGRDQYHFIAKKADRCECAERAVIADGGEIGQVKWICREKTCKDHAGRRIESYSRSSSGSPSTASPDSRNKRKQELFDIKVDEEVRKRVFQEAIKTFAWPLDREHLNEAIKEFFRRLPSDVQRTVCEVVGWSEQEAEKLRLNNSAVLRALAGLDENQLGQFLVLCSFAHYGSNQYKNNCVDQSEVIRLGKERNVNHTLIDAEVRAELCPKKYKGTHRAYLEAVKSGKPAKKPVVHERLSKSVRTPSGASARKKPAA